MWNSVCVSCMSWRSEPSNKYDGNNNLDLVHPPQRPASSLITPPKPPKFRLNGTRKSMQPSTLAIANSGKGAKHTCLPYPYPEDESEYPVGFEIQMEVRKAVTPQSGWCCGGGLGCRGIDLRGGSGLNGVLPDDL
jgi:hypothetical protein